MNHLIVFSFIFLACLIVFFLIISFLFLKIDESANQPSPGLKRFSFKRWLGFFLLILICWLPYLVICSPAITLGYDYFWQLLQGTGIFPISDHHPVLSTYVFEGLFSIGCKFGGAKAGLLFTMIFQSVLMSAILSYCLSCLSGLGVPKKILFVICTLLCLCPVFPLNTLWLIKDSIFTSICVLLFFQSFIFIWSIRNKEAIPKIASLPAITVSSVLFSLYRHGVTIVALILMLTLIVIQLHHSKAEPKKRILKPAICMLSFLLLIAGWNYYTSSIHAMPTNIRESLSFPVRHVMRSLQLHPNDKKLANDPTLKKMYSDNALEGKSVSDVAKTYNDFEADSIKPSYISNNSIIKDFIKLWYSTGLKYPSCYIDATIRGTAGYWWLSIDDVMMDKAVITSGPENDFSRKVMRDRYLNTLFLPTLKTLEDSNIDTNQRFKDLFSEYPQLKDLMNIRSSFPKARAKLSKYMDTLKTMPVISIILTPGFYFWILLFSLGYLLSRKKTGRELWPIMIIVAMAFLSPVNGYTRYVLSAEIIALILLAICFIPKQIIRK